ncbi:hypothetical protein MAR_033086, partial [Mya arenaria]
RFSASIFIRFDGARGVEGTAGSSDDVLVLSILSNSSSMKRRNSGGVAGESFLNKSQELVCVSVVFFSGVFGDEGVWVLACLIGSKTTSSRYQRKLGDDIFMEAIKIESKRCKGVQTPSRVQCHLYCNTIPRENALALGLHHNMVQEEMRKPLSFLDKVTDDKKSSKRKPARDIHAGITSQRIYFKRVFRLTGLERKWWKGFCQFLHPLGGSSWGCRDVRYLFVFGKLKNPDVDHRIHFLPIVRISRMVQAKVCSGWNIIGKIQGYARKGKPAANEIEMERRAIAACTCQGSAAHESP